MKFYFYKSLTTPLNPLLLRGNLKSPLSRGVGFVPIPRVKGRGVLFGIS
jgi:hypothetical protein